MNETTEHSADDLAEELRSLGQNLKRTLEAAWESDERRQLQHEVQRGLAALRDALDEAADEFTASDTGQRLRAEVDQFEAKVRSGEVERTARDNLAVVLQRVNAELAALAAKLAQETEPAEDGGGDSASLKET